MAGAVVCLACGAKIKAGRERCLRCGEALPAQVPPSDELRLSERGPLLIGGTVVSLLVLAAAMFFRGPAMQPSLGPAGLPVASQPVGTPAAAPPIVVRPFFDSSHAGQIADGTGDIASTVERLRKAVQNNPDDGQSLNDLGLALVRAGRPVEALQHLGRAATINPGVWEYRFDLARAYSQIENWTRAITEYEAAVALSPDDYATLYNLGLALHWQGREEDAIARFQRAIELAPAEPSFQLALGVSYEGLKRPLEAANAYRRYLELAPANAPEADSVKARIQALTQL